MYVQIQGLAHINGLFYSLFILYSIFVDFPSCLLAYSEKLDSYHIPLYITLWKNSIKERVLSNTL